MRTFELKRISVNGRCKTFGVLVIKSASGQISPLTRVNPFNIIGLYRIEAFSNDDKKNRLRFSMAPYVLYA